ncbi:hypothetical protein P3S68_014224 [Capsicum galapagoense]
MDQDSPPYYISKNKKPNCELVPTNHADSCKFYNMFSFKTMLVVILVVALPFFPLGTPEIISQTLNTGNWELVQLILVGIAVSYGLFSKKSDDEIENEYLYSSKFNNGQSRLLEVSSFFYDEAEKHDECDENRVQTWNNCQYYSGKPIVVVAKEIASSRSVEKPLLLPIRSLKSPVIEPISTTTTSPKSMISSPRKLSTSLSFSSESDQAKIEQFDHKIVRKKSFNKSSDSQPPSPPPLPPSPIVKKSTLLKPSSIVMVDKGSFDKEPRRRTRSVPFELSSYKGKSVRTIRPFIGAARARVYAKDVINGKAEERNKEVEETFVDKWIHEECHYASEPALMEFSEEEKKTLSLEKVVVETDEDSDDYIEESSKDVDVAGKKESNTATDGGPDNVDKKADEFIAKFREQIRLQRIKSVRTLAGQPAKKLLQ